MSLRSSRISRISRKWTAPLLAGACLLACSAARDEGTGTASQAATGAGLLHSDVTRANWTPRAGESRGPWDQDTCHPGPLALCPLLDSDFLGVDAGPACAHLTTPACPDRVDTWDDAIVFDFATAISSDCRFGQWAPPLLTDTDVVDYLNDLLAFTLQFLGCPLQGTTGELTFGLIPAALQGHTFTTADLDALVDAYVAAVGQALSDNGSPPLTQAQSQAIGAKLARLARHVPGTVASGTFTFSTCAGDAGAAPVPAPDGSDVGCF